MNRGVTELDVAGGYHDGQAHRMVATAADELLDRFAISTKVSARPGMPPLVEQAGRAVDELGQVPAVVLLHNPEHVLDRLPRPHAQRWWFDVAAVMAGLVERGLCRAWGIACWDPRPLSTVLPSSVFRQAPRPAVVMVRAGLLVPAAVLTAVEALLDQFDTAQRWGMSPFAGEPALLRGSNAEQFLASPAQAASAAQAGVAAALHLPPVSRLAVGASNPQHLDQIVEAARLAVDHDRLSAYRRLLSTARSAR